MKIIYKNVITHPHIISAQEVVIEGIKNEQLIVSNDSIVTIKGIFNGNTLEIQDKSTVILKGILNGRTIGNGSLIISGIVNKPIDKSINLKLLDGAIINNT